MRLKKILLSIFIFALAVLFFGEVAGVTAQTAAEKFAEGQSAAAAGMGYDKEPTSLSVMIGTVIKTILTLLGVVFLVLMIYGGFKWMKASGREADVEVAKKIIENAIIGLLLVVCAYALTAYVASAFVKDVIAT